MTTVILEPSATMNWVSHGRLEDAEEMEEEILRFLGTPCEDDRSLLILHFNHYKLV